jgi:hypothetical protein
MSRDTAGRAQARAGRTRGRANIRQILVPIWRPENNRQRSMAMWGGRTQTQTQTDAAGIGAPRLLNAAAWLEALAALEAEFETILDHGRPAERHALRGQPKA